MRIAFIGHVCVDRNVVRGQVGHELDERVAVVDAGRAHGPGGTGRRGHACEHDGEPRVIGRVSTGGRLAGERRQGKRETRADRDEPGPGGRPHVPRRPS